jgi:quercetin dioxygenase-like cupin family protein
MNRQQFEAQLDADGYTHVETKTLAPRPANERHGHPYGVRGLVLSGTFIVVTDAGAAPYQAGEVFSVAADVPHAEEIGPDGAEIVVGRLL